MEMMNTRVLTALVNLLEMIKQTNHSLQFFYDSMCYGLMTDLSICITAYLTWISNPYSVNRRLVEDGNPKNPVPGTVVYGVMEFLGKTVTKL